MSKTTFLFIAGFFLCLALFSGGTAVESNTYVIVSVAMIALLGIPHGAIDHVLAMKDSRTKPILFYSLYIGSIFLYVAMWLIFPELSMVAFLVLSAYHFGQSQLPDIDLTDFWKRLFHLSWGASILSGLILYNQDEIISLNKGTPDMEGMLSVYDPSWYLPILIISSLITSITLLYALVKGKLSSQNVAMEFIVLLLIHISFFLLPILAGFTLYFIVLHSLRVMKDEYEFLQRGELKMSITKFVRLLLPFTLLSLIGSGIVLALSSAGILPISNLMLVFILISVITLPHSFVMERFYAKFR